MGRPTSCTPTVRQAVTTAILAGGGQELAARQAGISPAAHYGWLARGRKALTRQRPGHPPAKRDLPFVEYLEAVEDARRRYEFTLLEAIREVAVAGVPYSTTRTVEKLGKDEHGGDVVLERTTTVTEGARRDWKAGVVLLRWARPDEYGERPKVDQLSAEDEARLVAKAIEGAFAELGVEVTPAAREVVGRHLELVVSEHEAAAS